MNDISNMKIISKGILFNFRRIFGSFDVEIVTAVKDDRATVSVVFYGILVVGTWTMAGVFRRNEFF